MSRFRIIALAIVVAATCFPAAVTVTIAQSPTQPIEDLTPPGRDLPPRMPGPGVPEPPTPAGQHYEGFQLVGFSSEQFAGNRGVLNMTRACAVEYEQSRICTASEIMNTVEPPVVPVQLRHRLAWVIASGAERFIDLEKTSRVSDCKGWSTDASRELGLAIELGEHQDCYGGFMPTSCEQELVVACCAMK